ncbi:hypothetical protein AHAS_Ahas10G0130900 [Arachis hypogaea]
MVPVDGNIVPTWKYLKPPADTGNLDLTIPAGISMASSTPPKSTHQCIEDLHKKLDHYGRRNQHRYAYVKKLLSVVTPPMEELDVSTSTATSSEDTNDEEDDGHSKANRPLHITNGTEDRAKF